MQYDEVAFECSPQSKTLFNSFAPVKKNVRKVVVQKTVIINHN